MTFPFQNLRNEKVKTQSAYHLNYLPLILFNILLRGIHKPKEAARRNKDRSQCSEENTQTHGKGERMNTGPAEEIKNGGNEESRHGGQQCSAQGLIDTAVNQFRSQGRSANIKFTNSVKQNDCIVQ